MHIQNEPVRNVPYILVLRGLKNPFVTLLNMAVDNIKNMTVTIKAKLLTYREEYGGYIIYIFEDLNTSRWDCKYRATLRLPNWESPFINIGDVGYLTYKEVIAGKDTWWDRNTQSQKYYNYNNSLFEDFVLEKKNADSDLVL